MFRPVRSLLLAGALLATAAACIPAPVPVPTVPTGGRATAQPATLAEPAPGLALGITHTHRSYETWYDRPSMARADAVLAEHPGTLQNVHVMGWGMGNPEPSPGRFDWASLDRRLDVVARTGGTPVVTLCCAPDWMKGGQPGQTNWANLERAPSVEHFDEYAELARQVALRHPEVRYYLVWNELKGFHDNARNRWRYEDYTRLYNLVYDALKSVDPTIQVGGPYVPMATWRPGEASHPSALRGPWGVVDQRALDVVTYWLQHKHGADFIAVDGSSATRNGDFLVPPEQSVEKFRAISEWITQRTDLPLWWAELYPTWYGRAGFSPAQQADIWQRALDAVEAGGGDVVLYWQPEAAAGPWAGLWTSAERPGGGVRTAVCDAICARLGPVRTS